MWLETSKGSATQQSHFSYAEKIGHISKEKLTHSQLQIPPNRGATEILDQYYTNT